MKLLNYLLLFLFICIMTFYSSSAAFGFTLSHNDPKEILVTGTGNIAVITGWSDGRITMYTSTGTVLGSLELPPRPISFERWVDPISLDEYAIIAISDTPGQGTDFDSGELIKVKLSEPLIIESQLTLEDSPIDLIITSDDILYVISGFQMGMPGHLMMIDPSNLSVLSENNIGCEPRGIAVSTDGTQVYVGTMDTVSNTNPAVHATIGSILSIYSAFTLELINEIAVGPGITDIISTDDAIYVSSYFSYLGTFEYPPPTISKIDLSTMLVEYIFHESDGSFNLEYIPETDCILVNLVSCDVPELVQEVFDWGPSGVIGYYSTLSGEWHSFYDTGQWIGEFTVDYQNNRLLVLDVENNEMLEIPLDACDCT